MNQQDKYVDIQNKFQKHNAAKLSNRSSVPTGDWVTVTGQFKPARIVFSQDARKYFVNLESIAQAESLQGKPGRRLIVRISGASKDEVKREIIARYGRSAAFSDTVATSDPAAEDKKTLAKLRDQDTPVSDAEIQKAWHILTQTYGELFNGHRRLNPGTVITAEMCLNNGIRQKVFDAIAESQDKEIVAEQTKAWRELCLGKTPKEVEAFWQGTALEMMKQSELAPEFKGKHDFLSWSYNADGTGSNWNWHQLVNACHALGVPQGTCPTLGEMIEAYRYCQNHGHFRDKSYKRSQQNVRDEVRPVSAEHVQTDSESARERGVAKVNAARLPAGFRLTADRAAQIGVTPEEFDALVAGRTTPASADFGELQDSVRAGFNYDPKRNRSYGG